MTKRRTMAEHYTQKAIFDFARLHERHMIGLKWMHSIPNAGKRTGIEAYWMRDEGLTAGVADICLPFPINGYHGLYAEIKTLSGRLTDKQREFLTDMGNRGYLTDVWRSFDQAQLILTKYVTGEIFKRKAGCYLWQ